jgi:hypothetical protein
MVSTPSSSRQVPFSWPNAGGAFVTRRVTAVARPAVTGSSVLVVTRSRRLVATMMLPGSRSGILKVPSRLVCAARYSPSAVTITPGKGAPLLAETTTPEIVPRVRSSSACRSAAVRGAQATTPTQRPSAAVLLAIRVRSPRDMDTILHSSDRSRIWRFSCRPRARQGISLDNEPHVVAFDVEVQVVLVRGVEIRRERGPR